MCKHLGNPPPPQPRLLCRLWGAHLSRWAEAKRATKDRETPRTESAQPTLTKKNKRSLARHLDIWRALSSSDRNSSLAEEFVMIERF